MPIHFQERCGLGLAFFLTLHSQKLVFGGLAWLKISFQMVWMVYGMIWMNQLFFRWLSNFFLSCWTSYGLLLALNIFYLQAVTKTMPESNIHRGDGELGGCQNHAHYHNVLYINPVIILFTLHAFYKFIRSGAILLHCFLGINTQLITCFWIFCSLQ